jgi:peptidoglycan hydrolase-like protein with peptidoglycan-binding domain
MATLSRINLVVLASFLLISFGSNQAQAYTFSRNLKLGDQGEDVRQLQIILNQDQATTVTLSGAGSKAKYQAEVLIPAGLTVPSGFVGALTRAKMASLSGISGLGTILTGSGSGSSAVASKSPTVPASTQAAQAKKPLITAISPTKAPAGTIITITGEGFLPTGNTVYTGYDRQTVTSSDGKTITFIFNPPFASGVQTGGHLQFSGIPFHFYVGNTNGTSGESPEFNLIF